MLRLQRKPTTRHGDETSRPEQQRTSHQRREIAEQYDIPIELMAKVLQRLVRVGLLASTQGTRGGYTLGRPPLAISVADVIEAIDGPFTVTACSTEKERLRAVQQVQYPRSAVADSRADCGGPWNRDDCGDRGGACVFVCTGLERRGAT
jgi:Rrf2 family protein